MASIPCGGYWRQPERTLEAFRGLWFHTGDFGRFDEDGYLYFVDRRHLTPINRGRRPVTLDLKDGDDRARLLDLLERADVLLDPYRPGVLERLGLGPDELLARFPPLVVARMTGWGQDGPRKDMPGHDINFISLSGVLNSIGTRESGPVVPLMYLGDFFNALSPNRGVVTETSSIPGWPSEPEETMAEAALLLCTADPAWVTRRVAYSLPLLCEFGRSVRTLDGAALVPKWQPDDIDRASLLPSYLQVTHARVCR